MLNFIAKLSHSTCMMCQLCVGTDHITECADSKQLAERDPDAVVMLLTIAMAKLYSLT